MLKRYLAGLLLAALVFLGGRAEAALPPAVEKILKEADKIALLSLDPGPGVKGPTQFHGYKVLGQTVLEKKADRDKLVGALLQGISDSKGLVAGCFIPRHGIRASHDGKTVELVICFQCLSMQVYVDGKRGGSALTTSGPQSAFNAILKAAKVPLPRQPE